MSYCGNNMSSYNYKPISEDCNKSIMWICLIMMIIGVILSLTYMIMKDKDKYALGWGGFGLTAIGLVAGMISGILSKKSLKKTLID